MGMSDFVQKLNYRRALQGVSQNDPQNAGSRTGTGSSGDSGTAPVYHGAGSCARIGRRVVAGQSKSFEGADPGIVHLVSSSVEGSQARDVTVVDGHGNLLSNSSTDESAGFVKWNEKRTLEKDIETRIQTMLERIVGVNKAVVRVSSGTGFQKVETTEERYDPNGQVVRSEQRGQENRPGVNGNSGGVPGVESNVPGGTGEAEGGQSSSNSNNQTKTRR